MPSLSASSSPLSTNQRTNHLNERNNENYYYRIYSVMFLFFGRPFGGADGRDMLYVSKEAAQKYSRYKGKK